jgi:hypothetical protein
MYRMATKLQALEKTEKGSIGEKLEKNLDKQDEIKKWFGQQLSDIDNVFKKYLKIEH